MQEGSPAGFHPNAESALILQVVPYPPLPPAPRRRYAPNWGACVMRHLARFLVVGCLVALPIAAQRGGGMHAGGFRGGAVAGGFRGGGMVGGFRGGGFVGSEFRGGFGGFRGGFGFHRGSFP